MEIGTGTLNEIRKEAVAWLVEMDLEPEHWDRRGFTAWLKSSPRHMEEFLDVSALWAALNDLEPGSVDARPPLEESAEQSSKVVEWPHSLEGKEQDAPLVRRPWWYTGLAVATLILGSVAALWTLDHHDARILTTAIGEQRAVRLADRSVVHLNTDSRVEIRFTDATREVDLIQGEALFTVERDPSRPFRVHTDGIQVEAIGTQFNVRRRSSETVVSVVEGRVAVVGSPAPQPEATHAANSIGVPAVEPTGYAVDQAGEPPRLPVEVARPTPAGALAVVAAGEQVRVATDGTVEREAIENVTTATAWRQRQLVFSNTPLAEVVTEVARYNAAPRLRIEGDALRARQLNGVFAADDPESLVQFLERDGLLVIRNGDTIVIRAP